MYGPSKMGYNRANWDLRYAGPKQLNFLPQNAAAEEENPFFNRNAGPAVIPGTYKVTVTANGKSETKTVEVALDPRFPNADVNGFKAQVAAALEVRDETSALNEALNRINSLKKQLSSIEELLGATDENGVQNAEYRPVLQQARAMRKKLDALEEPIYNHDIQPGASDDLHYLSRFQNRLRSVNGIVNSGYAQAPNELAVEEMTEVRKELDRHLKEINDFLNNEVVAFNKLAIEKGSSTLFAGTPITVKSANDNATGAQEEDDDDNQ
jgi:DNA-binding protein YbaB